MLFRPQWEAKTDPLTMEGLIAWLETKPADETYDYENCHGDCLYGQYVASHGISWEESRVPFMSYVYQHVAHQYPWTFGTALERARKAVAPHRT